MRLTRGFVLGVVFAAASLQCSLASFDALTQGDADATDPGDGAPPVVTGADDGNARDAQAPGEAEGDGQAPVDPGDAGRDLDASPVDGGPTFDAGSDGGVVAPVDAGSDGGVVEPVDAGGFCDNATFCDQFERDAVIGPWTAIKTKNGTLTLDPTRASSATRSLKAVDNQRFNDGDGPALTLSLGTRTRIVLRASFFLDSAPTTTVNLANITFNYVGGNVRLLSAALGPNGFIVQEYDDLTSTLQTHTFAVAPVYGAWNVVRMELQTSSGGPVNPAHLVVGLNGQTAIDDDLKLGFKPGPVDVSVGTVYRTSGQAFTVWVDDVRVDALPQ